jgi:hypothetical protein
MGQNEPLYARIKVNGKTAHLGYFATPEEAAAAYDAAAYDAAAKNLFGKFAKLLNVFPLIRFTTLNLNADTNVTLNGNVLVRGNSIVNVSLLNNSVLTGAIQDATNVLIESGSTWNITDTFSSAVFPGVSATTFGPHEGHDSAIINAGVGTQWTPRIATYIGYQGQLGRDNYDANGVTGTISFSF